MASAYWFVCLSNMPAITRNVTNDDGLRTFISLTSIIRCGGNSGSLANGGIDNGGMIRVGLRGQNVGLGQADSSFRPPPSFAGLAPITRCVDVEELALL